MDRETLAKIIFKENCEYESSTSSRRIALPQQLVQINLNVHNVEENRPNGIFCYDDKIKLEANVTYKNNNTAFIKTGRIEFYFIPEGSIKPILINKPTFNSKTCELNKNGSAAVYFKPTSTGKVFAKYVDDNNFYSEAKSQEISLSLKGIPVNIEFCELPPYIANIHDEVTIKVHVTNAYNNEDIKYGLVTFAHYLIKDDSAIPYKRTPKIIGNPVPVFNGYAEINYIPVQSDDYGYINNNQDTEPEVLIEDSEERYVEYIRASYNYSGKYIDTDKGDYKWKYYDTNSKWTGINVLARNTININPPKVNNTVLSLNGEKGIYQCQESDIIELSAVLKDKNNKVIDFENNYTGILTFHIKGTHPHPKQPYTPGSPPVSYKNDYEQTTSEFNFLTYEKDIDATFSNGQFVAQIKKPLPGFYTITATTTIMTKESNELPLIDYSGTSHDIENDKKYAQSDNSNTIYISSNYNDINYRINLMCNGNSNQIQQSINNLKGVVSGLSNNQMSILNNRSCYFYIQETNNIYKGTLSYSGNQLIGEPTQNITFNSSGDYHIYMYIPHGVYTNNTSIGEYHHDISSSTNNSVIDFYLPYYSSLPITLQHRDTVSLELSVQALSDTVPAKFLHTLSGSNINGEESIQLVKRAINSSTESVIADDITLFEQHSTETGVFEIDQPNEYEVYAKNTNEIISNSIEINVKRANLTQVLLDSSKEMFASINNTIGIYLTCHQSNINLINYNKINIFLYDSNKANEQLINIKNIKTINNTTIYLEVEPCIWKEGVWYIKVTYDGDNNFSQYNGIFEKFISILDTPEIILLPHNNNFLVDITSPHCNSNIIVSTISFNKGETAIARGVFVSDNNGHGVLSQANNYTWWNSWDNILFTINPYDAELLQIINDNNIPYLALKSKYENIFDYNQITNKTILQQQLINNDNKYIFNTYKSIQIKITRPTSL